MGWEPCEDCGETRVDFDERYRPVCRGCGTARVRALDPSRDGAVLVAADPAVVLARPRARGWAGRTRGVKVTLVLVVVMVALMIGLTIYGLANANAERDSGAVRDPGSAAGVHT